MKIEIIRPTIIKRVSPDNSLPFKKESKARTPNPGSPINSKPEKKEERETSILQMKKLLMNSPFLNQFDDMKNTANSTTSRMSNSLNPDEIVRPRTERTRNLQAITPATCKTEALPSTLPSTLPSEPKNNSSLNSQPLTDDKDTATGNISDGDESSPSRITTEKGR